MNWAKKGLPLIVWMLVFVCLCLSLERNCKGLLSRLL